ncbi:MAG: hypothetical protein Q8928_08880 [Bacteroidota bacterium]|nr:hypothetical protein [Bacteroidota bacterium]
MKSKILLSSVLILVLFSSMLFGQTAENNPKNIPVISKAPISFRVNESGSTLHGYYKKGYSLTIYGDSSSVGYRADCDKDDDWSGAIVGGTTQSSNSFESEYHCVFNPHILHGTVLPGNKKGQRHWDNLKKLGVGIGDLTITYKLDKNNNPIDSVIGVVFDRGPHNQPGESSVATCNKFRTSLDNNQFIYIIFPNTAKYVKQSIGTKSDSKTLKRTPTNTDFEQAYKLMVADKLSNARNQTKGNIVSTLSSISIITDFDNATAQEKAKAKLKPKNNDRNLNE